MAEIIKTTFQFRRGTAEVWSRNNPVLERGEPGFEIDTNRLKIGNGSTLWNDLPYLGGNEWSISPDGNTLVISSNNQLQLYGFEDAETDQIPIKGADGKLHWLTLNWSSLTGYIDDLQQRDAIVINGGSAIADEDVDGFRSIIRLRRDNDFNYAKIADTFIPENGEICLVDTAREGLQVICGDGVTPFGKLSYLGGYLVKGYYKNGTFYSGLDYAVELEPSERKMFIDLASNRAYQYNGITYVALGDENGHLPTATAEIPGIMKLYETMGDNTDGTMTQKAITDELSEKVEIALNIEEGILIFT